MKRVLRRISAASERDQEDLELDLGVILAGAVRATSIERDQREHREHRVTDGDSDPDPKPPDDARTRPGASRKRDRKRAPRVAL